MHIRPCIFLETLRPFPVCCIIFLKLCSFRSHHPREVLMILSWRREGVLFGRMNVLSENHMRKMELTEDCTSLMLSVSGRHLLKKSRDSVMSSLCFPPVPCSLEPQGEARSGFLTVNLRDPWDPRPFTPLSRPVPRPALPPVSAPVYNVRATEAPSFRALPWSGVYICLLTC